MHSKDARSLDESEPRLHLLAAWREASCCDARERTALAWCEDLTLISTEGAPDAAYEELGQTFSPKAIVALPSPVGGYVSPHRPPIEPCAASQRVGLAGTHAKQEGEPCP